MEYIKYELELGIQQCIIQCGVPNVGVPLSMLVELSIGGIVCENGRTELSKMVDGKVVWNKKIVTFFSDLEPAIPIIISLTLYRKRVFKHGFKLIGTAHVNLTDLIPMINRGVQTSKLPVNVSRTIPATASLSLSFQFRTVPVTVNTVAGVVKPIYAFDQAYNPVGTHVSMIPVPKLSKSMLLLYIRCFNTFTVVLFAVLTLCAVYNTMVY